VGSEIKGAWFVAARAWLEERGALETAATALNGDVRHALLEPIPAAWYPEEVLQEAMRGVRTAVVPSSDAFVDAMDGCTVIGTSRFFRALLRVASPAFVLRQVPTMWRQIRRGDAKVAVMIDGDRARIQYSEFPYFSDENYRLLTEGSLRAVVRTCTGRDPKVTVLRSTADSLNVELRWRSEPSNDTRERPSGG